MSDPRIVEYLRLNMGKYPVDALKAALVKQGFAAGDVDAAAAQASGSAPPPPPPPGADGLDGSRGEYVSLGVKNAIANAKALFQDAQDFFSRLDPEAAYGPAVTTIMFWGCISGFLALVIAVGQAAIGRPSPFGLFASGLQIVILPIMGALLSWLGSGIFHVICLILGGRGAFKLSYQTIAAMSALFPVSTLLGAIPYGTIPVQLYGLYLTVAAASAAHGVKKGRAWAVFGILTGLGILGSLLAQLGMSKLPNQAMLNQLNAPRTGIGQPQGLPADAAQMLSQLGGQMTPEAQKAMQDAMENPGAIVQELTRYGNLAEPPQATLALLDAAGKARLNKSWPTMSAPMRKSLIETLPSVPAAERTDFMAQMDSYTKDMNATLDQSMKLLQQTMEQQGGQKK
ncbi:MAG: YIP1 family protein [Elusimicrobia bacterium]|nr:YIP1 family protein [Elusimicrobiota bacterium]